MKVYMLIDALTAVGKFVKVTAANVHISALHLKETVSGKFREVPYCTGHVNFK
jgi:L-ribulose-5-phosphate 3-epimerase UlaE